MLYYRGDKFVKGKKFTINESVYKFVKKSRDNKLIFESIEDKSLLKITESEYNNLLQEKINKDNAEINELIGKALRSKPEARKIEDRLAQYGITVDYNKKQGVYLKGPNGKRLSASQDTVTGPTKPGFNDTHKQDRKFHSSDYKQTKARLDDLKNMSDEEKLKKFGIDSRTGERYTDKEALERYNNALKSTEDALRTIQKYRDEENRDIKAKRRAGHNTQISGTYFYGDETDREHANKYIDYLTYLTKKPNEYQDAVRKVDWYGISGPDATQSQKDIGKYYKLKNNIRSAQSDVNFKSTYHDDNYRAMKDDELEAKIKEMRDNLEKQIEDLRKNNARNNDELKLKKAKLDDAKKKLDDFLKSKGVRESIRNKIISKKLYEEAGLNNKDYYNNHLNRIYNDILDLAKEAQHDGYADLSKLLDNILSLLDNVSI